MSELNLALGALTGGGTGALDKIDGAGLSDGDAAVVVITGLSYHYHLNATSGATENSPYVISPDINAGTKRWVLVTPAGAMSHVKANNPTTGQTIATGANTTLVFDTEEYDDLGEYNTSTGIFTATHAGVYFLTAITYLEDISWATGDLTYLTAVKNTTTMLLGPRLTAWGTTSLRFSPSISLSLKLAAADTLKVQIFHDRGSNTDTLASTTGNLLTIDRLL